MKATKSILVLNIFFAAVIALATGCAAAKKLYHVTPAPVVHSQPVFGIVTNSMGVVSVGQVGITNIVSTGELWQVNSNIAANLETAKQINAAVPTPLSPILAGVLGLATTLLGIYGAKKSGQLSVSNAALTAVISGVEAFDIVAQKKTIHAFAVSNGSQDTLDAVVQDVSAQIKEKSQPA